MTNLIRLPPTTTMTEKPGWGWGWLIVLGILVGSTSYRYIKD